MKCIAIATLTSMNDVDWHIPRLGYANFFVSSAIKPYQDEIEKFLFLLDDNSQHVILKDNRFLHIQRCINSYCIIVADEKLSPLQLIHLTRAILIERIPKEEVAKNLLNYASDQKIKAIQETLDETRKQMLLNLEKLVERGERIQELVKKTEELEVASFRFEQKAEELNRCWPSCVII